MTRCALALFVTLAPLAALAQEAPTTRSYTLGPRGSDLYVVLRSDPEATLARLGHDHVIYASDWSGTVTWPMVDGAPCSVSIELPVAKLVVDPPGLRGKAGLDENGIDDSDKEKMTRNMWGSSQIDAASFPKITYTATSCSGRTGPVKVTGNLSVRGKSQPVTLTMDVSATETGFSATGKFQSSHTAFGFKPYAASAFGPRNLDALTFVVRVQGSPK